MGLDVLLLVIFFFQSKEYVIVQCSVEHCVSVIRPYTDFLFYPIRIIYKIL